MFLSGVLNYLALQRSHLTTTSISDITQVTIYRCYKKYSIYSSQFTYHSRCVFEYPDSYMASLMYLDNRFVQIYVKCYI
jgi:hypothetical protein